MRQLELFACLQNDIAGITLIMDEGDSAWSTFAKGAYVRTKDLTKRETVSRSCLAL